MGAVDYIYGGMQLICVESELAFLTTAQSNDICYITASRTPAGERGMLFYRCHIRSAIPNVEMADSTLAQPGYFGRPWSKSGETVFFETQIDTLPDGRSLITNLGWHDGLTGVGAPRSYEFPLINTDTSKRAAWATVLTAPTLNKQIISPDTWD